MSFSKRLIEIDTNQLKIEERGKIPEEILKKISYKFRLEWNYNSNAMEGNSLTRQETRTVMVGNITVNGKPIQDVFEIKQHDEVISSIIKMGKGEMNVSEKKIKEIHAAIMYEEDPAKRTAIGQWKKQPNYIFNYKGERFDFVEPAEVPDKMHKLINWLNHQKDLIEKGHKGALHPVLLAFEFHLEYITIHPFYDGNGRTCRILTNIILIAFGYPPLYIKLEERKMYYQYLADIQGYGGSPDLFFQFMSDALLRSQNIVLDALDHKSIEEPDDLDKKLFMLEKELEVNGSENDIERHLNKEVFFEIYKEWLREFLLKSITIIEKFNHLFSGVNHFIGVAQTPVLLHFSDEKPEMVINRFTESLERDRERLNLSEIEVSLRTNYGTFKKGGIDTFNAMYGLKVKFERIKYEISVDRFSEDNVYNPKVFPAKLLHIVPSENDMDNMVKTLGETLYQHIDFQTKKLGLR